MRRPGFFATVSGWWDNFFEKRLWSKSGGGSTTSLEDVTESTALKSAAVWCCTRLLCGIGSSLPLPIFIGRHDDTRTKDRNHKAYQLLNIAPNPEQTACQFRSVMWQWQVNHGNAYAEIEREGNNPDGDLVALWPLHPDRVTVCRDEDGILFYKVKSDKRGEPDIHLDAWRVLHIPSILTYDGIVGLGVIEYARESIGAALAGEKSLAHSFGGGNLPRMVMEKTPKWSAETKTAFREEFNALYSGADGAKLALLEGDAMLKPLSFSALDSQFIENRHLGIEDIARFYGVPPHLLQHLLRATDNNIEHLGINFVQYSLISWLRIWEQAINQKLLHPDEQLTHFAEHNVDALLRGDHAARAEFYKVMIAATIMRRNEARKLENLDPVPGGDTFLVQGAMVPLDENGRPESSFVNGTNASTADGGAAVPTNASLPTKTIGAVSVRAVTSRIQRKIGHDLGRFLTKETNAMAGFAKKPDEFVTLVDAFYTKHSMLVRDEMIETLGALSACGVDASVDVFVTSWVNEGKSLMLEASGTASTAVELSEAVQLAVDSRTWTERPLRAVEGVGECKV